ncbi:uncharacterized protein [Rutidosis leptorrhynchoides]|uniref:uncharacterized protein n=1 Tax=Rutidosis leptorrhynchoides TaxID=125765 RepID=UPI003A99D1C7
MENPNRVNVHPVHPPVGQNQKKYPAVTSATGERWGIKNPPQELCVSNRLLDVILSLNIRGFAVDGKFRWVKRICSSERPSFAKDAMGNSGGLLLIWDSNYFEAIAKADGDFFLAVKGRWKSTGSEFVVVNVYGPHNDVLKILFWDSLEKLMGLNEEAWVLCGDFNEVREHDDRLNCIFHQHQVKRFNEFILRNRLVEIPINGKKFTRISDDGTKFSKLDRFLVSDHFIRLWDDLSITTMDRFLSDHVPIILQEKVIDFSLKPFKVFDEWLNKEGIEDVINEAWGKLVKGSRFDCNFRDKMKNVKFALKFLSSCTFGGLDNEIITLKKEAHEWEIKAENNGMNDVEREKWLDCRRRWIEKEKVKANMLKQNARIRWILEGDENSRYFHATIKRKQNKCNIRGFNINGVWTENPCEVNGVVFEHFRKQFSRPNSVTSRPTLSGWAENAGMLLTQLSDS